MKTIIFISGWSVPETIAKSKFIWNDSLWINYNKIYLSSKTPTSDHMVEKELDRLSNFTNAFTDVILAGHSLGAWWAANLACHPQSNISKLVFWTPLCNANEYPIFNVTQRYHPINKIPNNQNIGPNKVLVFDAKYDFIVPPQYHAYPLRSHFKGSSFTLVGGHFYQKNHTAGLHCMKDWIDI